MLAGPIERQRRCRIRSAGFGPPGGAACGAANAPLKAMTMTRITEALRAAETPCFIPTSLDVENMGGL